MHNLLHVTIVNFKVGFPKNNKALVVVLNDSCKILTNWGYTRQNKKNSEELKCNYVLFKAMNSTWYRCPEIRTSSIDWTGRWIMSRNIIFLLMYHYHKLLDLISLIFLTLPWSHSVFQRHVLYSVLGPLYQPNWRWVIETRSPVASSHGLTPWTNKEHNSGMLAAWLSLHASSSSKCDQRTLDTQQPADNVYVLF
jgi:hypothetical protein